METPIYLLSHSNKNATLMHWRTPSTSAPHRVADPPPRNPGNPPSGRPSAHVPGSFSLLGQWRCPPENPQSSCKDVLGFCDVFVCICPILGAQNWNLSAKLFQLGSWWFCLEFQGILIFERSIWEPQGHAGPDHRVPIPNWGSPTKIIL